MNIAIDGPAGAGKSTIAKKVAAQLCSIYVDTGAMYRAMALYMLKNGVSPDETDRISALCENCEIRISYQRGSQHVFLFSDDVTAYLRDEEVGKMASAVSKIGRVREKLVELQQKMAEEQSVVMDGRDIGTVVLPDAELKIYLTADPHVRAVRRAKEISADAEHDEELVKRIEEDIIARDTQDMTREISPLRQAEDAVLLDTSDLTIDEVSDRIIALAEMRNA